MPAAVTPSGVRDGDPAALAGLCAARGPSVLAYCRHVAGDADAGAAASQAFATFRAAVVATPDPADLNPEALLINATRSAAAGRAPRAPLGVCTVVPLLLAGRAARTISIADLEILEQHLEGCWACRAPVARQKAAERAYRDPPDPAMDPLVVTQIIDAMAAAAPARGAAPPAAPMNGGAPAQQPVEGGLPVSATDAAAVGPPTTEFYAPDVLEPDPAAAQIAADNGLPQVARPAGRAGMVASLLGSLRLRPGRDGLALAPRVDEPEPESELVLEAVEQHERTRNRAPARAALGAHIPRVTRTPPAATPAGVGSGAARSRLRRGLPLPIVLPIAVVLIAVLVALFVAGVFSGSDPESSSRVGAPSDRPAQGRPADVVGVPGAKPASADDVELTKARGRARARREREAAVARESATTTPATAPAAATTPSAEPASTPAAPPPPPATQDDDSAGDASRKVDAGSGASGAESSRDTSTVPDLAPPTAPTPAP